MVLKAPVTCFEDTHSLFWVPALCFEGARDCNVRVGNFTVSSYRWPLRGGSGVAVLVRCHQGKALT